MFQQFINEFNIDTEKYRSAGKDIKFIMNIISKLKHSNSGLSYSEYIKLITPNFNKLANTSERLFCIFNNLNQRPKCASPGCTNDVSFINITDGFRKYCSGKCSANDPINKEKTKQTNLEKYGTTCSLQNKEVKEKSTETKLKRYGTEHVLQNKEIRNKVKETNLKKYGVEVAFSNKEVQAKVKKTILEKYGVEHVTGSKEIQDKVKATNLERYGTEYPLQNKDVLNKVKKYNLEKYGVEYLTESSEIHNKIKRTNLEKYGVEYPLQSEDIKEKIKITNIEKYGFENPLQNKEIRNKVKETNLEKYNVDNVRKSKEIDIKIRNTNLEKYGTEIAFNNKEVQDKVKKTILERYGVEYPLLSNQIREKIKLKINSSEYKRKLFNAHYERIVNSDRIKKHVKPLFNKEEYIGKDKEYKFECLTCNNIFEDDLDNGKIPRCLKCNPFNIFHSKGELELLEFAQQYFPNSKSNKTIIPPYEIDIFIPEKNIAIEYNGLYWHSEIAGKKDSEYHVNKYKLLKEKNISLISIFEDEWFNKQDIVKSIVLNKLGKTQNKIHARKCEIKEIKYNIAKQFLDNNHLQGSIISKFNIGLFFENELVSLLTLGTPRYNKKYEYEIFRFCNKINYSISGGLSKLLNYFIKKYNPKNIITYADLRYGEGSGYVNSKFKLVDASKPNYYYLNPKYSEKESRIKFQKHKLKNILKEFDSKLTEWGNMQLNNYDRIWDCGNYVYEWKRN